MSLANVWRTSRSTCPLAAGVVLLLGGWLIHAPAAPAAEVAIAWGGFRGPGGQGVSSEKGLPTTWGPAKNIAWKVELPGAGTSSPIVVGKRLILTCYSGYNVPGQPQGNMQDLTRLVLCLNLDDGKTVWSTPIESKLPEQESIRDDHGYASSTPAADAKRIYTFFGKSGVVALDHDGKQLWQADVGSDLHGWGSAASPLLYRDLVIVNAAVESQSLVALRKSDGKEVWRATGIQESWNTPILVDVGKKKTELVLAIMGKVLGFEPATGKPLWSCDTDIGWYMVPSLVADKGIVYCIGGRSGGALAVKAGGRSDVTSTHRLWTGKKGSNVSSPILHEGHLYWMHEQLGIAYCANAKTGDIVYEERVDGASQMYSSPVLVEGKLYYTARDGRTFVVAARPEYELLADNSLDDGSMFNAPPAIAGSRFYLRSDRYLYCIGR